MAVHERLIHAYVHAGRIGVLVELEAETDFALRTEVFRQFAQDLAMHIAAASPDSLDALLAQPFVRQPDIVVARLVEQTAESLREDVAIVRFLRWETHRYSPLPQPPRGPAVTNRA